MKYLILLSVSLFFSLNVISQTIDQQVDSLLRLMTLEEKVGQMTQVERGALVTLGHISSYGIGSILSGGGSSPSPNTVAGWANMYDIFQRKALESRLGIPLIYGVDAVHGHNNVYGAVIFPHNIGMGCTWNPALIEAANKIVAKEVAATGIDWTFAPCIAVPRNERWGRTYEGFGETAEIQKIMARASVLGLQGTDLGATETILACAKHFVADGGTINGGDQGNAFISEQELRAVHMEGYKDAIAAKTGTVMASYSSWNGVKLHGHNYLLTNVLKNELGFEGFVISDWKGVDQVDESYRTAIKRSINAGVDMVMVPDRYEVFIGHLLSLVRDGEVSQSRIDDAVRRILKQKFLLNLFEKPFTDNALAGSVGSREHRDVARQVVRESIVLLDAKNDVLPLKKNNQTILVAGQLAADLGGQCGGWTISWTGGNGAITQGTNILTGIQKLAESSKIIHAPNGNYTGSVDVAVVVIGEKTPYVEGGGDRSSLVLDPVDVNLLKTLKEKGIPTIALLVSGRPMIFGELLPYSDAMLAVWYPGTEGDGIAEVLFGDYQPSGKLTHSWPKTMAQIPINVGDNNYNPLYAYKHGLDRFPTKDSAHALLPYAASTTPSGDKIVLALSGKLTLMEAANSDFTVKINGVVIPNSIREIRIANYDKSILELTLNRVVDVAEDISLSYAGRKIASAGLALDSLINFFVYNAVTAGNKIYAVPGRVEAEHFFAMNGIQTEPCTDIGGGENVGYIESGDWIKYNIHVTQSGLYRIVNRIAGFSGGTLLLTFNDSLQTSVHYSATNGWQNWQSFNTTIHLKEGVYVMQARAQASGFNINYFNFELLTTAVQDQVATIQHIVAYPNPVESALSLEFSSAYRQPVTIKLIDLSGRMIQDLYAGTVNSGQNQFRFSLNPNLPKGVYFIEIKDGFRRNFQKLVKE